MPARIECLQASEGQELQNGITVAYTSLNHPDGVFAYKLQDPAGTLVYTGDTEHDGTHDGPRFQRRFGHSDQRLIRFATGAHTLLADAQYTPEEFDPAGHGKPGMAKKGWGHSTYVSAINIAVQAGVRRLILTHHDPGHDDKKMSEISERAKEYACQELAAQGLAEHALEVVVAKEGLKVMIGNESQKAQ